MGNEISTLGGAVATLGTSVAAGVTFGQVTALNDAVVDCAKFTAKKAKDTTVRHVGEAATMTVGTAVTAVAAGVTLGQVESLNQSVVWCAERTGKSSYNAAYNVGTLVDNATNSIPVVGHAKGGVLYACGYGESAAKAMKAASRTTGVVGGGVAGFIVGGPAGAIAGGVLAGGTMDGITTGVDSAIHGEFRPNGHIAAWHNLSKAEAREQMIGGLIKAITIPVFDGLAGSAAGDLLGSALDDNEANPVLSDPPTSTLPDNHAVDGSVTPPDDNHASVDEDTPLEDSDTSVKVDTKDAEVIPVAGVGATVGAKKLTRETKPMDANQVTPKVGAEKLKREVTQLGSKQAMDEFSAPGAKQFKHEVKPVGPKEVVHEVKLVGAKQLLPGIDELQLAANFVQDVAYTFKAVWNTVACAVGVANDVLKFVVIIGFIVCWVADWEWQSTLIHQKPVRIMLGDNAY